MEGLLPSSLYAGGLRPGLARGALAREAEVIAPARTATPRRSKSLTRWETFKFYLRTSAIVRACRSFLGPGRSKRGRAERTGQVTTPEMMELEANPPQKIAILCTDECNSRHLKEIEMLSRAHAVNGDHIFTSGSVEANAAVIKGALRGGHPEHLTVVLPQTEAQQERKLRQLIPTCVEAGAHVVSSPGHSSLRFEEAAHLCHQTVLGKVDQLVAFLPHPESEDGSLVDEAAGMSALAVEAGKSSLPPPQAIKQLLPDLKLFCKEGPGLGKGRFPARWLPAYGPGPGGVMPVLNDDAAKAAMLTPAQSLQLLGVLDHPKSHFPSAARLQAKDARVIAALGVLRLSDPAVSLQTRISGEPKLVPGSGQRIGLVLKLLWRSAGKEFATGQVEVSLRKCEAIGRELSLHSGEKASRMEAFAIWGDADPDDKSRSDLLVAGDPDDYVAEVEELFESRFEMVFRACETRPAKVLRLLRHLESEKDFNKFLARDFAGVLEQEELERRKSEAKARVAEQAAQASRAADAEAAARRAAAEAAAAAQQTQAEAARQAAKDEAAQAAERARQAEVAEFLEAAKAAKARREAKEAEAKAAEAKAPTFVPASVQAVPADASAPEASAPAAQAVPAAPAATPAKAKARATMHGMVVAARFPIKPAVALHARVVVV
ncbi:unnamed protein product [Symbiodinium natans]|uniref:Uncharacterized protein n=1 Tax=Symbiodinium natans TaxID=878477 RepID=A0A812I1W4_9DINO|nr:unnamed protein product [Symbiodinium natans]